MQAVTEDALACGAYRLSRKALAEPMDACLRTTITVLVVLDHTTVS